MRIYNINSEIIIDFLFTKNNVVYDLEEAPKFHICNKSMQYFDILSKTFVNTKKQYSMIDKGDGVYISDITGLLPVGEYFIYIEAKYNDDVFTENEFYKIEQVYSRN